MNSVFMKVYAASLAMTVVFLGLSSVMAQQVKHEDMVDVARVVAKKVGDPVELRELNDAFEVTEAVRKIEIHGENGLVAVRPSTDGKVHIKFKGRVAQDPQRDEHGFRVRDSVLEIKAELASNLRSNNIGWVVNGTQLNYSQPILDTEVLVPVDWNGEVEVKTSNGTVTLKGVPLKKAQVKVVNGTVDIEAPALEQLEVTTISGEIDIEVAGVGSATLDAVSGDIEFKGKIDRKLEAKSVSGDIEVKLDPLGLYQVETKTISGEIKNELAKAVNPSGLPVHLKTTSGDISIKSR